MSPLPTVTAATTSWPEAALGIAGVALIGAVVCVVVWQALATWRTRIAVSREHAYQRLAEQFAADVAELREQLAAATAERDAR
jgi:hypothetical protein